MENIYLLGLGWIVGLLSHSLPQMGPTWGWALPMLAGLLGAGLFRHRPKTAKTMLAAGLVSLVAWAYLGWRLPAPAADDISFVAPQAQASVVGEILTDPQTTRSERERFWFQASEFTAPEGEPQTVSGKVYVTLDPEVIEEIDVHPGQTVRMQGFLYTPRPALNLGGFDFKAFLAKQGSFAGISAYEVEVVDPGPSFGGWALRRRVRGALVRGLGPEQGELLSSIVMGSRAAELSYELRDTFRQVGLAHVLAASGFHVSLLIAVVLALASGVPSPRQKQLIVFAALGGYITLTGFSPSVLRAAIMGSAAILALTESEEMDRARLQPLAVLLLAAVLLLIWNPTWITDLGFLLSFAATLGLLVSVQPVTEFLSFVPQSIAVPAAVSLSAQLWTLPLQLLFFGKIANYFLVANLATLMFILVVSIAGFAISAIALLFPTLASLAASPLQFVLTPLINLVTWISTWPRATYYVGNISWIQCVLLYAALAAVSFWPLWKDRIRWQGTGAIMAAVLLLPNLVPGPPIQVTALASGQSPVMVIQTRKEAIVVNSGSEDTVTFTLIPFLRSQGIRQIDHAIATTPEGITNSGWASVFDQMPVKNFWAGEDISVSGPYSIVLGEIQNRGIPYTKLQPGQRLDVDPTIELRALNAAPLILALNGNIEGQDSWLLLGTAGEAAQVRVLGSSVSTPVNWVWWNGGGISRQLLEAFQVGAGITTNGWQDQFPAWFEEAGRSLYDTNRDGALTWIPPAQLQTVNAAVE